ncbi:MAG: hypothetical protein A3I68_04885 [Candidatus Melainabacteria bacterium RIFCSPLOWO2_02_FULL_35_15]|nr:MAG: hypothetical protein A3F80_07155 [Candidatus Melainabacteria bacterium RIFCSPLOWO2_12_FULL_35_11]OGI12791.1 MAG: hypothetical protein A3I68_04885 [Candidatus Melainabacteria bacterium RIFCSPLOWO2_02_FULL_35_15]
MGQLEKNEINQASSVGYLEEQISYLRSMLSYALDINEAEIKINFPTLKNFYFVNNIYKSSWAIYTHREKFPRLLYTGNFLIQGGNYAKRSTRSPFGIDALSSLTSVANTFSFEASLFKQNWTLDLDLFQDSADKLKFSVKEYKDFLQLLNRIRAQWLLHLSEEGNFDFVIIEFSEPSDPVYFVDLGSIDSLATKVRTYFKPISEHSLNLFQKLALGTEFEGKFFNLQPDAWLRDDVIIEIGNFYTEKIFEEKDNKLFNEVIDQSYNNPFKMQAFKPIY